MRKILVVLMILMALLVPVATAYADSSDITNTDEGEDGGDPELTERHDLTVEFYYIYGQYDVRRGFKITAGKETLELSKTVLMKAGYQITAEAGDVIVANRNLGSVTEMYIANGNSGFDKPEKREEKRLSLFYKETGSASKTIFSDWRKTFVNDIVAMATENETIDVPIDFRYTFGTTLSNVRLNTNADIKRYSEGIYYHTMTGLYEDKDKEFVRTQTYPDTLGWYLVSVLVGLVICGGGVAFMLLYNRKKNGKADKGTANVVTELRQSGGKNGGEEA